MTQGLTQPVKNRVVILKIDAEGFDPLVLMGARLMLSAKVPSILLFEYHGKNMWAPGKGVKLLNVIQDLAYAGYSCYFDGQPTLTRITGCWIDAFWTAGWSNVVCALTGSKYQALLESLSFLNRMRAPVPVGGKGDT